MNNLFEYKNEEDLKTLKKLLKYLIMFIVVLTSSYYIPVTGIDISDAFMIGVSAACCYCILDLYSPSVCNHNDYNKIIGVRGNN